MFPELDKLREKGKHPQILRSGDVVKIRPNIVHWHGTAPDSEFIHTAIGLRQSQSGAVRLSAATEKSIIHYHNKNR